MMPLRLFSKTIVGALSSLCFLLVLLFCVSPAYGAWSSGNTNFYPCIGLTGGGPALDGISGVSIGPFDVALVFDVSGGTVYFYDVDTSGATTEDSPNRITPDDLQAGGSGSGSSMWQLMDSRVSGFWSDRIYVRTTRWDDDAGKIDGEQIADDTIDDDSIDLTDITLSDFTNDADFATNDVTDDSAFTGTTDFALDSAVTEHVRTQLTNYTADSAFTGTSDFALDSAVTSHVSSAVSDYPYKANDETITGSWDFEGVIDAEGGVSVRGASDLHGIVTIEDGSGPVFQFKPATGDFWFTDSGGITNFQNSGAGVSPYLTGFSQASGVGILSGDTNAGTPTGTWDFSSGTATFSADEIGESEVEDNIIRGSIGFSWTTSDGFLDDSRYGFSGVMFGPFRMNYDCVVENAFLSSQQTGINATVQMFYLAGSDNPGSGNSFFVTSGVSIVSGSTSFDTFSGSSTMSRGDAYAFMFSDLTASGVTTLNIIVGVRKN